MNRTPRAGPSLVLAALPWWEKCTAVAGVCISNWRSIHSVLSIFAYVSFVRLGFLRGHAEIWCWHSLGDQIAGGQKRGTRTWADTGNTSSSFHVLCFSRYVLPFVQVRRPLLCIALQVWSQRRTGMPFSTEQREHVVTCGNLGRIGVFVRRLIMMCQHFQKASTSKRTQIQCEAVTVTNWKLVIKPKMQAAERLSVGHDIETIAASNK